MGGLWCTAQSSKKVSKTLSQNIAGSGGIALVIPSVWEAEVGGLQSEASPLLNYDTLSKSNLKKKRQKWLGVWLKW
jgi:hypothetical protein